MFICDLYYAKRPCGLAFILPHDPFVKLSAAARVIVWIIWIVWTVIIAAAARVVVAIAIALMRDIIAYSGKKLRFLRWWEYVHWEIKVFKEITWAYWCRFLTFFRNDKKRCYMLKTFIYLKKIMRFNAKEVMY